MLNVVFYQRLLAESVTAVLEAQDNVRFVIVDDVAGLVESIASADVLVTPDLPPDDVDRLMARRADQRNDPLWVQVVSASYSGFSDRWLPPGTVVTNQGGAVAPTVAEHAIALLLACSRRLPAALQAQQEAQWAPSAMAGRFALEGKRAAIVGFGHVGREIAKRLRAFDVHVTAVRRFTDCAETPADEVAPLSSLHEVLAQSQLVFLAAALTSDTHQLFGAAELAVCRADSVLVNVGRGGLIDHDELARALDDGRVAAAAIDVTDPEPLLPDHPLWQAPNLIVTPHVAGGGGDRTAARFQHVLEENLRRYMAGEQLLHIVARGNTVEPEDLILKE